jgi:hypothetical protein
VADFAYLLSTQTADLSGGAVTAAPTLLPTLHPTMVGYEVVEKEVEVAIVSTALAFPLTQAELSNPVMRTALEAGIAAAIGFDDDRVAITSIDGHSIRRRLGRVDVAFDVASRSSSTEQLRDLKTNLVRAANEGSIVANVQKEAASNGVLVDALQTMPRMLLLDASELQDGMKRVKVFEAVRSTALADGDTDSTALADGDTDSTDGTVGPIPHEVKWKFTLEVGEIVGIGVCALCILVLLVRFCCRRRQSGPKEVIGLQSPKIACSATAISRTDAAEGGGLVPSPHAV